MDRIKFFQLVVFAAAAIILARLFYWQFLSSFQSQISDFSKNSEIPASRGEIYTSDGFPIVTNQEAFLIYAKPHEVEKPKEVAQKLAPLLIPEKYATVGANVDSNLKKEKEDAIKAKQADLENKLGDKTLFWVQLARKITKDAKEKIQAESIKGLGFERDEKRFYPEASMAAQLLGFVGSDKLGRDTGYFGLEGYWDRKLQGKPGSLGQENDPNGLPILVGNYQRIEPKKGSSLYLSLDRTVQFIVENQLKVDVEKYGAKDGSVIVADPKTGHILALATYPTYDPANRQEYDAKLYKNPVIADNFEPGSIFKPVAMSSALDLSLLQPETKCPICAGPRKIGGYEVSTWNKKYFPDSTMTEVIQHSDNVGMTYVAQQLGLDKLYSYITKFGFGKTTEIDLQEESPGVIHAKDEWHEIDLATASFGQGIAITPIQMIQAISAIANGGKLIPPRIVTKVKDENSEEEIKSPTSRQVISPKTAAQVGEMMVNAVARGEAQFFAPRGYRIAGKTGTAQIPVAGHYDPNKTIASFVGFAPADDPKFVMLVRFTEPTSSPFGAETAAPTFFAIARDLFTYYSIPPAQ